MTLLELDRSWTSQLYLYNSSIASVRWAVAAVAIGFIYTLPVLLVWLFFSGQQLRIISAKIFIGTLLAWQVLSQLIGSWLYGAYAFRDRPFADRGLQEFLFERPTKSFPSDHAAVGVVVVLLLFYYGQRRLGWFFLALVLLMSLARVMVGFHFLGDILGGWLVGLAAFSLMVLTDKPLSKALGFLGQAHDQ